MSGTALSESSENRQTELRLEGKARRVFTVKGWNDALRAAGIAAGNFWIGAYGVLRWNKGYAQSVLGYTPGSAKRKRMARGEAPFFSTGTFMDGFNSRARTEAVAKKGRTGFWVVVPAGRLNFVAEFRRIPQREVAAVAREFRRSLIQAVMTGRTAHAAKQQAKASARLAKKQATAARRAEARANRSTRRTRATRSAA